MVVCSGLVAIYYNVIITYTIFYMLKSMTTSLPWVGCHHEWNTPYCSELVEECFANGGIMTANNTCVKLADMDSDALANYNITSDSSAANSTFLTHNYTDPLADMRVRPSEEYYRWGALSKCFDLYIYWVFENLLKLVAIVEPSPTWHYAVPFKVLWRYFDAPVTKGWIATMHAVAAKYPGSTLNGTAICCV